MDKQYRGQIEINDLIDDAVNNAVARRSQIDSELSALSDQEVRKVAGGIKDITMDITIDIHTCGMICQPTTSGMIAQ